MNEGVIVIAATNIPESLDPALTRPGRFDRNVAVPLPDVRGRAEILDYYLSSKPVSPDVDVMRLARATPGAYNEVVQMRAKCQVDPRLLPAQGSSRFLMMRTPAQRQVASATSGGSEPSIAPECCSGLDMQYCPCLPRLLPLPPC